MENIQFFYCCQKITRRGKCLAVLSDFPAEPEARRSELVFSYWKCETLDSKVYRQGWVQQIWCLALDGKELQLYLIALITQWQVQLWDSQMSLHEVKWNILNPPCATKCSTPFSSNVPFPLVCYNTIRYCRAQMGRTLNVISLLIGQKCCSGF